MIARSDRQTASRRSLPARVLRWLTGLMLALVLIVCVTLVAVFSLEQFSLKPLTELLVEKATGRALLIEGGLDARAGRVVSIHAGGIRLANAEWSSS